MWSCENRVYRLILKWKDRDFVYLIPLALLSLAIRLRYVLLQLYAGPGIPPSPDSDWYIDYAHSLMTRFHIGLDMNDLMYVGYNVLLTLLLAVFKDPAAVVIIQAATAGLSVIFVYKIARMLFNRSTACIASVFYAFSWDITLWSTYILTDSFFISLLLACVYFLLKSFESGKRRYKALFAVTAAYMLVFKPTGIFTVLFLFIYIAIRLDRRMVRNWAVKYRVVLAIALVAVIAAAAAVVGGGRLDPFIASLQQNAQKVLYNMYAKGWIYDIPSEHDYPFEPDFTVDIGNSVVVSFFVHNWQSILALYGRRALAFLGRWVWETNLGSFGGIVHFIRYALPIVLFAIGTAAAAANGLFRKASVVWLVALAVFAFCLLFFIDGLYRYKAPGIPFMAIAAAYGADRIVRGIIVIAKKYTGMLLWNKEKY